MLPVGQWWTKPTLTAQAAVDPLPIQMAVRRTRADVQLKEENLGSVRSRSTGPISPPTETNESPDPDINHDGSSSPDSLPRYEGRE